MLLGITCVSDLTTVLFTGAQQRGRLERCSTTCARLSTHPCLFARVCLCAVRWRVCSRLPAPLASRSRSRVTRRKTAFMMINNNDGREGFPWGHRQVARHVQQRLHPQDLLPQPRPRGWGARIVCHRRGALGHDQPSRAWRSEASTKPRVLLHHGMEEESNFFMRWWHGRSKEALDSVYMCTPLCYAYRLWTCCPAQLLWLSWLSWRFCCGFNTPLCLQLTCNLFFGVSRHQLRHSELFPLHAWNFGIHRSIGASIWCLDVCYLTQNNEPNTYRLCRKWLTSQIKTQVLFSYLQQRSLACKAGSIPRHNWFQLEELHASTMTSSCPRT